MAVKGNLEWTGGEDPDFSVSFFWKQTNYGNRSVFESRCKVFQKYNQFEWDGKFFRVSEELDSWDFDSRAYSRHGSSSRIHFPWIPPEKNVFYMDTLYFNTFEMYFDAIDGGKFDEVQNLLETVQYSDCLSFGRCDADKLRKFAAVNAVSVGNLVTYDHRPTHFTNKGAIRVPAWLESWIDKTPEGAQWNGERQNELFISHWKRMYSEQIQLQKESIERRKRMIRARKCAISTSSFQF